MDLFELTYQANREKTAPLAERMRPQVLEEYYGQAHLVGKDMPLYRMIKSDRLYSIILYGPPGTGKTTLARIVANTTNSVFESVSAVTSGVKELRELIQKAKENLSFYNKRTIIFIDEIHRFNKAQQDALLPYVENGEIVLIGATTENPYFEVNKALLSRSQLYELKQLDQRDIESIVQRALIKDELLKDLKINISSEGLNYLSRASAGDARVALNSLEVAVLSTEPINDIIEIDENILAQSGVKAALYNDKYGDEHYDTISAFIKSMRGSDVDASLLYLAKMLESGEDPRFIARRLIIFASEDIGNADPRALGLAIDAFDGINIVGMPEGRIILSQIVIYLASTIKSDAAYLAIERAIKTINEIERINIPSYLKDNHYSGAEELGRGEGYKNPHKYDKHYIHQSYLPESLVDLGLYQSANQGYENTLSKYLAHIKGEMKNDLDV